jgi:hypothetical protein
MIQALRSAAEPEPIPTRSATGARQPRMGRRLQRSQDHRQARQPIPHRITQAARLFAMGNLVGADALIACFEAKYHYLFWRPQFAIPRGDTDGNPATAGDPTWKPLLGTPTHPEYPSGHGCLTGAEAEVFAAFLKTNRIDLDLTSTVPNLLQSTRHYDSVADLTQENMNARVWGGIHFRDATIKGVALGRKVANWALKRYFLPER